MSRFAGADNCGLLPRDRKEQDPSGWQENPVFFTFSANTSGTVLRDHLVSIHREEYAKTCADKGWLRYLAYIPGYAAQAGEQNQGDGTPNLPPFTRNAFLSALARFIAADDQVSIIISA